MILASEYIDEMMGEIELFKDTRQKNIGACNNQHIELYILYDNHILYQLQVISSFF